MESLYEVGDKIYVLSEVLEVDEEDTDVRYVVKTALGKLFVTEKKDTLRRDPYSLPVQEDFVNQGKKSMYAYIADVVTWNSTKIRECFDYDNLNEVLSHYTYQEFIDTYEDYNNIVSLDVGSVVKYKKSDSVILTCVVMDINAADDDNGMVYTLFDPYNRDFYIESSLSKITPAGKEISLDSILEDIEHAVDETY
jgi:hypothetical protein